MEKKKNNKNNIIRAIVFALIVGIVAFAVFLLTFKKETHVNESYQDTDLSSLVCISNNNDSAFFSSDSANSVEHKIKIIYNNDSISEMSYEYEGVYDSDESAEHDSAVLHARYNEHMGHHDIDNGVLTPIFQTIDNKLKIRLYLDNYEKMNTVYGKLFYIGEGIIETVAKNSIDETKKIYENKGFLCEKQN